MKTSIVLAGLLAAPLVMGNQSSCGVATTPVPTVRWLELNIPKSILTCPHAPASPGARATETQRAQYVLGLYRAWEVCHGNLNDARVIYNRWQLEAAKYRHRFESAR